jgi:hypothetical protein
MSIFWTNPGNKGLGLTLHGPSLCLVFGQQTSNIYCFRDIEKGQWYDTQIMLHRDQNIEVTLNGSEAANFGSDNPYQIKNLVVGGMDASQPLFNGQIKDFSLTSDLNTENVALNLSLRISKILFFVLSIILAYSFLFPKRAE